MLGMCLTLSACAKTPPSSESTPIPAETPEVYSPLPFEEIPIVTYFNEERSFSYGDHYVYTEAFVPLNGMETHPAVILCHGIGNDHSSVNHFAMTFAERGFLTITFDFCGGCADCQSSGTMETMSILTEAEDLSAVIDHVKAMDDVNPDYLFLLGQSQGGVVASLEAEKRQAEVRGLILMYPAYNVQDLTEQMYPDPKDIPETGEIYDQTVSRQYFLDALSVDFEQVRKGFAKDVLILHGSNDPTVPISYSEEAAKEFPHASLIKVEGAGHGFELPDAPSVDSACMSFLQEHTPPDLIYKKDKE